MQTTGLIRREVDLDNPPPLTDEQRAELEALAALPDDSIDYSDSPSLTEEQWTYAVRGWFHRRTWPSTTVRIEPAVLNWLMTEGAGVEFRINAILRREMLAALKNR